MPSLSTYDAPGSKEAQGRNVLSDIEAGNEAFERLVNPMQKERLRLVKVNGRSGDPRCEFLFGNHEDRINRTIAVDPRLDKLLTLDNLKTPGFTRNDFLRIVDD